MRPVIFAQLAIINYLGGINKNDEKDPETPPGADDGRRQNRHLKGDHGMITFTATREQSDNLEGLAYVYTTR